VVQKIQHLLGLIRFYRPVGFILLFIPCLWGLTLGANNLPELKGVLLFLLGSFFTRSAGCVYNDWVDRDIDSHVQRSKTRPLAAGELNGRHAIFMIAIMLIGAFVVFCMLPFKSQMLCLISIILVLIYPWMKRFTNWPQVVLGFAYSMGVPVGYAYGNHYSFNEEYSTIEVFIVYMASVMWVIFFDTIYAHQDSYDDRRIGVGSTTNIMPNHPKVFLLIVKCLSVSLLFLFNYMTYNDMYFYGLIIAASLWIMYLLHKTDLNDPMQCMSLFRKTSWWGWIVTMALVYMVVS
jgi:4-hydroxybenzoate polyprenyltransferase